jgi:DNA-binding transcriptional MerR regulator
MDKTLESLRGNKYVGAVQLSDEAARLLGHFVPKQERGSVTELPDERMLRYYSSGGLISPPESKQGVSAVYGYLHLLQLLVIKRLQAEHLSIRKIRELVEGRTERELEQLLGLETGGAVASNKQNAATEYLESLLQYQSPKMPPSQAAAHLKIAEELAPYSAVGPRSAWSRVEIEPGLELHIREDYSLTRDAKERLRLGRRILAEIDNHGNPPRK